MSSHTEMLGNQRGQSLVIALLILFMLVFIGGVFLTLIGRNMGRTKRSTDTLTAESLAEAGIRYAGDQLTYSADGADWRPAPDYPELVTALSEVDPTLRDTKLGAAAKPDPSDPDYKWLMDGFARFTYGKGRFLLRVTYDPTFDDAQSRYIKIESIGRMGVVDPNDPTSLTISQPIRLRSEKVAYKAIGINDNAIFITNKDRRQANFTLGTPGFVTNFGEVYTNSDGVTAIHGAPIRVNGDVTWYGQNNLFLDVPRGDGVEVAGEIKHGVYSDPLNADAAAALTIPAGSNETDVEVYGLDATTSGVRRTRAYPSEARYTESGLKIFDSIVFPRSADLDGYGNPADGFPDVGVYRDGSPDPDVNGRPRAVRRMDPPLVDASRSVGGYGRYRELTRNSGEWKLDSSSNWYNTGYYGWGDGMYIDNSNDSQEETSLSTLRGNWTEPGSAYWEGPYYNPPGVEIILTPYNLDGKDYDGNVDTSGNIYKYPKMILIHVGGPNQPAFHWRDKDGNDQYASGERVVMPYPKNGVIFAEGNVRIRGVLPCRDMWASDDGAPAERWSNKLTVVSGGTAYIEGNLLKNPFNEEDAYNGYTGTSMRLLNADEPKTSAISILATDYVCVNTTQFFGPTQDVLAAGANGSYFDVDSNHSFWMNFSFGVQPNEYVDTSNAVMPINLYVRHTTDADTGPSFINMLINYPPTTAELSGDPRYSVYKFGTHPSPNDYTYYLDNAALGQKLPNWEYTAFALGSPDNYEATSTIGAYHLWTDPGADNEIRFQLDQTLTGGLGMQDYLISRAAAQPCDIRIEAIMYAQNGSFFVIPGEWFNPNQNDTEANYAANGGKRPLGVNDTSWPYYAQPLDCRVVIYGAVSENFAPSIGDTAAWMEKWGWIPPYHGSNTTSQTVGYRDPLNPDDDSTLINDASGKPIKQKGLTFVYDSQLRVPRMNPLATVPTTASDQNAIMAYKPLRTDQYGRALPIVPKLPVSAETIYFGGS